MSKFSPSLKGGNILEIMNRNGNSTNINETFFTQIECLGKLIISFCADFPCVQSNQHFIPYKNFKLILNKF